MFEKLVIREICENTSYKLELSAGFSIRKEDREQWGLAILLQGTILYHWQDMEYCAAPGSVILLPKNQVYHLYCTADCTYWIVNFQADGLEDRLQLYPVAAIEPYAELCYSMSNTFPVHPLRRIATMYTLFANLSAESEKERELKSPYDIGRSVAYMQEHLSDPTICLTSIATQSQISVVYFRKLFIKEFGKPPMQWLYAQRIQKAKELLAGQDMRIAEVAMACGYSDIYSFSGAFKRAVGVSPTEYRKYFL